MNFYNDNDPYVCGWMRELVSEGLIPPGVVDGRPIEEIQGEELQGYTQCHFFCGIGGWSRALALAGWPEDRPVWTGSCPCQPFSSAGSGKGEEDSRHLWPQLLRLVKECSPPVCFGEQVASPAGLRWLSGVCSDLEAEGYAVGAVDLCAAGCQAPHIRQRIYWMADACGQRVRGEGSGEAQGSPGRVQGADGQRQRVRSDARSGRPAVAGGLADAEIDRRDQQCRDARGQAEEGEPGRMQPVHGCNTGGLGDANGTGRQARNPIAISGEARPRMPDESGSPGGLGHPLQPGPQGRRPGLRGGPVDRPGGQPAAPAGDAGGLDDPAGQREQHGGQAQPRGDGPQDGVPGATGTGGGFWDAADLIPCRDGKWRRVERGTFPLVDGLPRGVVYSSDPGAPVNPHSTAEARTMRLRGYGNAIVPQVAALFIQAYMDTRRGGR